MRPSRSVALHDVQRPWGYGASNLPILQRYRVNDESGCWEWLGRKIAQGYGRCKAGDKNVQAHRAFYEYHVGPIPAGHDIHHQCGNKGCVNPEHLEPLTRAKNNRRKPHGHTLLSWEEAREIRVAMDQMCAKYGVRPRTLAAIAERQIWVEDEL